MKATGAANEESKTLPSGQTVTSREPAEAWHTLAVEEAAPLRMDVARGLSNSELSLRYTQYGRNTLADIKGRSTLSIFVHQFRSLIVVLLLAAGGVAFGLGESVEAGAILSTFLGHMNPDTTEVCLTIGSTPLVLDPPRPRPRVGSRRTCFGTRRPSISSKPASR